MPIDVVKLPIFLRRQQYIIASAIGFRGISHTLTVEIPDSSANCTHQHLLGEKNSLIYIDEIHPFGIFVSLNKFSTNVYLFVTCTKNCLSLWCSFSIWDEFALNFHNFKSVPKWGSCSNFTVGLPEQVMRSLV